MLVLTPFGLSILIMPCESIVISAVDNKRELSQVCQEKFEKLLKEYPFFLRSNVDNCHSSGSLGPGGRSHRVENLCQLVYMSQYLLW